MSSSPALTPAEAPPHDGLPHPERLLAFTTLALAVGMSVVDGAIVNVALPTMASELQVSPATAVWIVNAFQVAVTVSLLPLSALGDSIGYRRVYTPGLALFTLASLFCALAPGEPALVVARIAQGLGAAGIMSVNAALVRFIYPSAQLGRAVGNIALVVAVSSAGSPTIAAAILSVASWRWLFLVNVPIGIFALVFAVRTLPATPQAKRSLDPLSVLLNALTFGLLIVGVDGIGDAGRLSESLALIAASAAVGVLFVRRQLRQSAPLLPVDLLERPVFALSLMTSITSFAAAALALIALPFFFVEALGLSAAQTGLLLTPWPVATALIAPIAGRLADKLRPAWLGSVGLITMGLGLVLVAMDLGRADPLSFAWRLAVCGLGFGFFQSPNNRLIIGSAPPHRSGGAAGLQSSGRLIGQSLGTAFMAIAFGRWPHHATAIALWTSAGLAFAGACASGLRGSERSA